MESEDNSTNNLRVASFSCYLKPHEDELNVFGSDKLLDMKTGYQNVFSKEALLDLHQLKFTPRTPSISSEASSWSKSQSTLLQRNVSQAKQSGRGNGKRFFYGFPCAGPCATKKAVYVNEIIDMGSYGTKGDQFAFPVPGPAMSIMASKNKQFEEVKLEEAPRKSLEVFGSETITKGDMAKNLERKMSILTWDAIPKATEVSSSTAYGSSAICDDIASEASSDLFEIENISISGSFTIQRSERTSSCLMSPPTQYAPSEASIEWSVVTASAAEFSSVYSDYDEKNTYYRASNNRKTAKNKNEMARKAGRSRPGGLLGCKSHKSVKVAEPVCRTSGKPKH